MKSTMMRAPEPTYEELLRMGWVMFWRGVGSFIVLLFGMNVLILFVMPELTRTEPSFWVAVLPLSVVSVLCTFVIMPFVARKLVRTPFRGFHVQFVRDEPANQTGR
jgi:hypothetical protein